MLLLSQVSPLLKDDQKNDQNLKKICFFIISAEQKILQTTVEKIGIFNREILSLGNYNIVLDKKLEYAT